MPKWSQQLLTGSCCLLMLMSALQALPLETEKRRVSRDLDKIDGLRAKLLQLQKQINALEPSEAKDAAKPAATRGRERGSDPDPDPSRGVGGAGREADSQQAAAELQQVRAGSEAQMAAARQQQVQQLAKKLGDGTSKDLRSLAETLNQLLRQTDVEESRRHSNTAGEYLGDHYDGQAPQQVAEGNGEGDAGDADRIGNIYNMLLRMYSQQLAEEGKQAEEGKEAVGESPRPRAVPEKGSRTKVPAVHIDEGTFGDVVDDRRPTEQPQGPRSEAETRRDLLAAIESRLLRDVQDAQTVGISVEDIIKDIQTKAQENKQQKLHEIETELDELTDRNL